MIHWMRVAQPRLFSLLVVTLLICISGAVVAQNCICSACFNCTSYPLPPSTEYVFGRVFSCSNSYTYCYCASGYQQITEISACVYSDDGSHELLTRYQTGCYGC
jgi:hypothetical protein